MATLLFAAGLLVTAALSPLGIAREFAPYPPFVFLFAVPVVMGFSAVLVLPVWVALPTQRRVQFPAVLMAAFCAGAVGMLLFSLAGGVTYSRVGATILVENGKRTPDGWLVICEQALLMGVLALPGGALFCLAERVRRKAAAA